MLFSRDAVGCNALRVADALTDDVRAFLLEGTRTAKLGTLTPSGWPHVIPIWFVLDADEFVFSTGRDTVKGRYLRRDERTSLCVDDDRPPFAYVHIRGRAHVQEDAPDLLDWTTRIAARYVGPEQAEAYGRRNAVPTELLVRVRAERVIAEFDVAGW
jgi:PPOX class probable F420-dependent enzyme